jgi:hypothetical protein
LTSRTAGQYAGDLDAQGLNIVEPSPEDGHVGNVVNLANWTDEKRTMLAPHPPEPTNVVIELDESIDGRADEED